MTILHRHIFASVALTCLAAISLFAFVLMVGNAIRDLLGYVIAGQLSLLTFGKLVLLLLPFVVSYALPMGILTGVLLVLGRMSAQNEVTALRAAGLGLPRLAAPIFCFALLGMAADLAVNFYFMPRARVEYHQELDQAVKANPLRLIVPKTFIRDFPGYVFYVGEKHGAVMKELWLWELDGQQRVKNFVRAEEGRFDFEEGGNALILSLFHATAESRSTKDPEDFSEARPAATFDQTSVRLPLDKIFGQQNFRRKLKWYTFDELMAEWRRLGTPGPGPTEPQRLIDRMKVQIVLHEKFSTAFSVLSFALIGVPLGIRTSRKETSANLGLAVALALGYYFLTVMVGWVDRHPELRPDLLMWVPNLIFQALGGWMFWRVDRR